MKNEGYGVELPKSTDELREVVLWKIKDNLYEEFFFINGDLIFSIDFKKLVYFHQRLSSNLTLVTHTSDHPEDSDLVSVPNGSLVEDIFLKDWGRPLEFRMFWT